MSEQLKLQNQRLIKASESLISEIVSSMVIRHELDSQYQEQTDLIDSINRSLKTIEELKQIYD